MNEVQTDRIKEAHEVLERLERLTPNEALFITNDGDGGKDGYTVGTYDGICDWDCSGFYPSVLVALRVHQLPKHDCTKDIDCDTCNEACGL